jgi:uncharacterized CHY-type Zn-finger protein
VEKVGFEQKSPEIQNFLEGVFGTGTAIKNRKCVLCGEDVGEFRDELSIKEYGISGMCQSCQDDVFGGSDV